MPRGLPEWMGYDPTTGLYYDTNNPFQTYTAWEVAQMYDSDPGWYAGMGDVQRAGWLDTQRPSAAAVTPASNVFTDPAQRNIRYNPVYTAAAMARAKMANPAASLPPTDPAQTDPATTRPAVGSDQRQQDLQNWYRDAQRLGYREGWYTTNSAGKAYRGGIGNAGANGESWYYGGAGYGTGGSYYRGSGYRGTQQGPDIARRNNEALGWQPGTFGVEKPYNWTQVLTGRTRGKDKRKAVKALNKGPAGTGLSTQAAGGIGALEY